MNSHRQWSTQRKRSKGGHTTNLLSVCTGWSN